MENKIIKEEFVINWKRTFLAPLKMWWVMLICAIVGVAGGALGGYLTEETKYQTSAVYMVNFDSTGALTDIATQMNLSSRVLTNCVVVARQNLYRDYIINNSNINAGYEEGDPGYIEADALESLITYSKSSTSSGTMVFAYATTESEEESKRLIAAVEETFAVFMNEQFAFGDGQTEIRFKCVNIPEKSTIEIEKLSWKKIALIAGAVLAVASYLIMCVIELVDVKIKDVEDLKNKYNAPIIGTVYNFTDMELKKQEEYKYGN